MSMGIQKAEKKNYVYLYYIFHRPTVQEHEIVCQGNGKTAFFDILSAKVINVYLCMKRQIYVLSVALLSNKARKLNIVLPFLLHIVKGLFILSILRVYKLLLYRPIIQHPSLD